MFLDILFSTKVFVLAIILYMHIHSYYLCAGILLHFTAKTLATLENGILSSNMAAVVPAMMRLHTNFIDNRYPDLHITMYTGCGVADEENTTRWILFLLPE